MRVQPILFVSVVLAVLAAACGETDDGSSGANPASEPDPSADATFADSTRVDNPYFALEGVEYRLFLGEDEGEPLRIEEALTGDTRVVSWDGGDTETVVSQFVETTDGQLVEVALDFYAQSATGDVWYFGEDVFNYEDGALEDMEGTWLAGADGPPGMIMPGDPAVGQVFNPENIPGLVFETVEVEQVGVTAETSFGRTFDHAILLHETLDDGTEELKQYAPGYGNVTVRAGDVETVDLVYALPNDTIDAPVPDELAMAIEALRSGEVDGAAVAGALEALVGSDGVPGVLVDLASDQLDELVSADQGDTALLATDLERTLLDLARLYQGDRLADLDVLDLAARRVEAALDAGEESIVGSEAVYADAVADRATVTDQSVIEAAAELAAAVEEGGTGETVATAAHALSDAVG